MNIFKTSLLTLFLVFGTALSSQAAFEERSFSDCLENASKAGKIVLVINDQILKTPAEAFKLMNDILYTTSLSITGVQTHMDLTYDSSGKPNVDSQGNPITVTVQRITAEIYGRSLSSFFDQNGMINQTLAEEYDHGIEQLKKDYPAIIKTECILVPGPGTRVGG